MKTIYVLVLVFLACATLLFGLGAMVFEGNALPLVQALFNCMLATGALLSYRES